LEETFKGHRVQPPCNLNAELSVPSTAVRLAVDNEVVLCDIVFGN